MLAIVRACAIMGLDGFLIEVQNDFNPRIGIPQFIVVGLPDAAVKESRERVPLGHSQQRPAVPEQAVHGQSLSRGSAEAQHEL